MRPTERVRVRHDHSPDGQWLVPGVVLMPGYQGTQQNLRWLAPRLASWGFKNTPLVTRWQDTCPF
ncbi:hypothetical protein [Streptomyces rapamycinicus]|uniref:Glycoside hydrolase family 18 n=2 Tax=Streptomyces rapamycinicus TaxID=1226757 RepID=A0A3L8R7J5_STRRN|nr:hypothetical protein [Streptomyces rapamycinicus]MBB4779585.1 dienelactone hydrolase [Streptomyces rapamycinicus]RLV75755.1 glycoside hydrolase family 18 [Streptomyces rapamycinicus NRRL 5491]UTP28339.1 hypothetical protein LIV37_02620 [Streptomyces rapamycinicus NRRL 5491]